ncbi:MAG: VOC family protein [Desulfarculaceae bacterium]|nr:VOC family protein [Desulfarculaceae bacterium]MCF8072828.1 VOC family protein [Desulfarculaceae bacterium]MCF8100996.1 VOC family protein [Desulfarculaceae bacterium]MCF8115617.1 VOC family protein [Desulfarculaceae bacterium]
MAKLVGINHVAFCVNDMEAAIKNAEDNLGGELMIRFESIPGKYKGACVAMGKDIVSYLEATDESSFVAGFIAKRGPGVQHMGLTIEDLPGYVAELEAKGVKVDKSDMDNEQFPEALVGPKTGQGVVLQLMGWKEHAMDTTPEGAEALKEKYRSDPSLRLIE